MTTLLEAAKQALEALEFFSDTAICTADTDVAGEAITALRQAIEQAEKHEPAVIVKVWHDELGDNHSEFRKWHTLPDGEHALYTTPLAAQQAEKPVADKAFEKWWDEEGSTAPKHRLDCEEHCYQIAKIAWSNGAYKAREATPQPQQEPVAIECTCKASEMPFGRCCKAQPVGKFAKFTDGIWREVTDGSAGVPLYTTPQPQRECENCGEFGICCQMQEGKDFIISKPWVGLTDEEIQSIVNKVASEYQTSDTYARAIEAKLKELNT